jgi:hypothetical protein
MHTVPFIEIIEIDVAGYQEIPGEKQSAYKNPDQENNDQQHFFRFIKIKISQYPSESLVKDRPENYFPEELCKSMTEYPKKEKPSNPDFLDEGGKNYQGNKGQDKPDERTGTEYDLDRILCPIPATDQEIDIIV